VALIEHIVLLAVEVTACLALVALRIAADRTTTIIKMIAAILEHFKSVRQPLKVFQINI
jgi:hypothetical protein